MEKKQKIRKILCTIFSFLLSMTLFATLIVGVLRFTLLDKDFFVNELEKSNYSHTLYEKIIEELSGEGYVSGFDEEFFSQILSEETVKTPVLSAVDRIYATGEYKAASVEENTQKFYEEFVKSLEGRGVTVDEEQKTHIQAFAKDCAEFLSSTARLPFLSVAESLIRNLKPLVTYAMIFLGAFALFCVLFIVLTNPKSRESLRFLSYGLTGTALMTAAPSIVLLASGLLKKISIADKAFYNLVQTIGNDISYIILWTAVAVLAVSVILIAIYFVPKKQ